MIRVRNLVLTGLAAGPLAGAGGCGGPPREESITVKPADPMDQVKATLNNYVKGQPLASEVTSFDYMVAQVKKTDPAKAEILKAGLEELKTVKTRPGPKAKELLVKLGLEKAGS